MSFHSAVNALEVGADQLVDLDVETLTAADAARWLEQVSVVQRRLSAFSAALAARAVAGNVHLTVGCRNGATWLANATGVTVGEAKETLATADRLQSLDTVRDAYVTGKLSQQQATHVAAAAAADPSTQTALVDAACKSSLVGLKRTCREVTARQASAAEEAARWERLRSSRYLRTWTDSDGMVCGQFRVLADDGARLLAKLKPFVAQSFAAARRDGRHEARERYEADGFCALIESAGTEAKPVRAEVVVIANYEALVRGWASEGERCEIEGVGPVPVALARSLSNDCFLSQIVVNNGKPTLVTGKGHYIPNRLRVAVRLRDRCCVVPGCDSTFRLEIDHIIPVAERGPTKLENLRLLCKSHHDLRTYRGFDIVTDQHGEKRWLQLRPPQPNRHRNTG